MHKLILLTLSLVIATPAHAWGPIGRRVTGVIADANLSGLHPLNPPAGTARLHLAARG